MRKDTLKTAPQSLLRRIEEVMVATVPAYVKAAADG